MDDHFSCDPMVKFTRFINVMIAHRHITLLNHIKKCDREFTKKRYILDSYDLQFMKICSSMLFYKFIEW